MAVARPPTTGRSRHDCPSPYTCARFEKTNQAGRRTTPDRPRYSAQPTRPITAQADEPFRRAERNRNIAGELSAAGVFAKVAPPNDPKASWLPAMSPNSRPPAIRTRRKACLKFYAHSLRTASTSPLIVGTDSTPTYSLPFRRLRIRLDHGGIGRAGPAPDWSCASTRAGSARD